MDIRNDHCKKVVICLQSKMDDLFILLYMIGQKQNADQSNNILFFTLYDWTKSKTPINQIISYYTIYTYTKKYSKTTINQIREEKINRKYDTYYKQWRCQKYQ